MFRDLGVLVNHGKSWFTSPIAHYLVGRYGKTVIASFPRSGSTWLRTMLTHLMVADYDSHPEVFNSLIPGMTLTRVPLVFQTRPELCSTHGLYTSNIKKAIYLVRDPRYAISSLYRYSTAYIGKEMPATKWARLYMRGFYGPRWDQHVRSWLGSGVSRLKEQVLLVRYERMRDCPEEELKRVAEFLGIAHDQRCLVDAVRLSSPAVMKKWEKQILGVRREANASFYRGGTVDEWQALFGDDIGRDLLNQASKAMCLAEYDPGVDRDSVA